MILRILSVLGYVAMAAGAVGMVLAKTLFFPYWPVISAQVAAGVLMLWARLTFRGRSFHFGAEPTEGELVTSGPYHFIRHPIYTAVCLFVWASFCGSFSALAACLAALVTAGAVTRILCEEHFLRRR
ncbi:MAG: methyltransferase [Acidobacteriota bacterium]